MEYVIGFSIVLLCIGLFDRSKAGSFGEYLLAGRRQSGTVVALSLMASCIGGSATVGVVGIAYTAGLAGWWWLGSGALGLLVLGFFLAHKLRCIEANTLPDLAGTLLGNGARSMVSVVIVPAWLGITAAQFVAITKILLPMTGMSQIAALACCAAAVTAYAALGGQLSVLKTDFWQFLLLAAALAGTAGYLFASQPVPLGSMELALVNDAFPPRRVLYYFVIMGGSYVVCPMLFSRLFTVKNPAAAKWATLGASVGLALMGVVVSAIGIWAAFHLPGIADSDTVLTSGIAGLLPAPLRVLLVVGLLAAIMSSADSCLITVGSIVEHDLLRKKRVGGIRAGVVLCGLLAAVIAWRQPDIIGLLIEATTIFTAGVVCPVAVALMAWPRVRLHPGWALAAVAAGGGLGLWSGWSGDSTPALLGVGCSLLLSAIGAVFGRRIPAQGEGAAAAEVA